MERVRKVIEEKCLIWYNDIENCFDLSAKASCLMNYHWISRSISIMSKENGNENSFFATK